LLKPPSCIKDAVPEVYDLIVVFSAQLFHSVFTVIIALVVQPVIRQLTKDEEK